VGFTENWYADEQLVLLAVTVCQVRCLSGRIIEFGCWEGKSTCALARAALPETVIAVDNWTGSHTEGEGHPTVQYAKQRDVLATFRANIAEHTAGNVHIVQSDHEAYIRLMTESVKFVHIDGAHDYVSVRQQIEGLKPYMVRGGIICGDDFLSASAQHPTLGGGVERAVRECCFGFTLHGNFWSWVAS